MSLDTRIALILASTSPYRRLLLERLGIPFTCAPPNTDETPLAGEGPEALAGRLSAAKALAVSRESADSIVIGSDQVAALDGELIGKPGDPDSARRQLTRCSGREVLFYTGIALARRGALLDQRCVMTRVKFRTLTAYAIADYVARDKPLDCAGSFRWEGLGIALFTALSSEDPTALEGLPLITLVTMLEGQQIAVLANSTSNG